MSIKENKNIFNEEEYSKTRKEFADMISALWKPHIDKIANCIKNVEEHSYSEIKIPLCKIESVINQYEGDKRYLTDSYISNILDCEDIYSNFFMFENFYESINKHDDNRNLKIAESII